jgi:hypothetical protein
MGSTMYTLPERRPATRASSAVESERMRVAKLLPLCHPTRAEWASEEPLPVTIAPRRLRPSHRRR